MRGQTRGSEVGRWIVLALVMGGCGEVPGAAGTPEGLTAALEFSQDPGFQPVPPGACPLFMICRVAEGVTSTSIASDGTTVYFTTGADGFDPKVLKVPAAGGKMTGLLSDSTNNFGAIGMAGGWVFWADCKISSMTVRNGSLYWTCSSCGTVMKQAIAAGSATTLATNQTSPKAVAVDDGHVYWGTSNDLWRVRN
jgi:hypothetical protein